MPTITGLKLSELSTLALGSTGTLFYAASAASNSYKMYEKDLYTTLNRLHISGEYQPKSQDWRFVHKTGNERITGEKTFVNNIILTNTSSLQVEDLMIDSLGNLVSNLNDNFISLQSGTIGQYSASPEISIDINNRILSGNWNAQKFNPTGIYGRTDSSKYIDLNNYGLSGNWSIPHLYLNSNPSGFIPTTANIVIGTNGQMSFAPYSRVLFNGDDLLYNQVLAWQSGWLLSGSQNVSQDNIRLDWIRRTLSGAWIAEQLQTLKLVLSGSAPSTPTSAGISGQLAMTGAVLFACTGTNRWGRIPITPW